MATEDVTVDDAVDQEATSDEDFSELDDFDWLLDDGAVDSSIDPDEPSDEDEQAEDEDDSPSELTTLKVGGADKQVTRDELIALAQQGEDYTRKTQELAAQREALQPLVDLVSNLDEDPAATLRWLAEQYGVGFEVDPETVSDPRDATVAKMQRQLEQINQQVAHEAAKREIQADLNRLEKTHGQFDREALIQFAAENRVPDMDKAYQFWQGTLALAAKAGVQKAEKTAAKHKARSVVDTEGSRRTDASGPATTGKISVRQAFLAAAQEAGINRRR